MANMSSCPRRALEKLNAVKMTRRKSPRVYRRIRRGNPKFWPSDGAFGGNLATAQLVGGGRFQASHVAAVSKGCGKCAWIYLILHRGRQLVLAVPKDVVWCAAVLPPVAVCIGHRARVMKIAMLVVRRACSSSVGRRFEPCRAHLFHSRAFAPPLAKVAVPLQAAAGAHLAQMRSLLVSYRRGVHHRKSGASTASWLTSSTNTSWATKPGASKRSQTGWTSSNQPTPIQPLHTLTNGSGNPLTLRSRQSPANEKSQSPAGSFSSHHGPNSYPDGSYSMETRKPVLPEQSQYPSLALCLRNVESFFECRNLF
jgi:hypothetical protein